MYKMADTANAFLILEKSFDANTYLERLKIGTKGQTNQTNSEPFSSPH